jgi:hypothetical protein
MTYNRAFLISYCQENGIILFTEEIILIKRETKIKGKCKQDGCNNTFEKSFKSLVENSLPYCKSCCIQNWKEKCKQTNLERYGTENPSQSEKIKEKIKKTNIQRYGTVCSLHSEEVKEKVKQTNLERYGTENANQ